MTETRQPTGLDDDALDAAAGGFEAWPSKWKGFSLNGKGNTASAQGGISDVSGLGTEITVAEHRDGGTVKRD